MNYKKLIILLFFISFSKLFCQTTYNDKIECFLNNFQYDSAYITTQKAIKNLKIASEEKANYYITYSRILKSISKTDSCFYYLDKAEEFYKKKQDQSKLFYILTVKAEIARSLVKRNIACNYIYEAEKLLPKNKNLEYKYYFLNRRIALLAEYYNNVPDSVKKIKSIGNSILENQKEIKDKSLIAYTLNEIGYLDFHKNPKNAEQYFLKAFKIAEKYNSKMALIDISINLGRHSQQKEFDYPKAIYYYQIGLKNAKSINNLWQIQQCYNELKNTTALSQDYKSAMYYGDSLNGIYNQLTDYNNNIKYGLLENKFILESKEKEIASTKKNLFLLMTVLLLFVIGIFVLFIYSKKIRSKNSQLSKLYRENEFLVSETNHRVNNNLQLIAYLISNIIRTKQNENEKIEFVKLLSKVEAIATIHRHLYVNKDSQEINLHNYLFDLKLNFENISVEKNIALEFQIDNLETNSNTATYLGLLLTELFINSVKHAFQENQDKKISFSLTKINSGISFTYKDNGKNSQNKKIKPKLVEQLSQQLEIEHTITTENGFHFYFTKK